MKFVFFSGLLFVVSLVLVNSEEDVLKPADLKQIDSSDVDVADERDALAIAQRADRWMFGIPNSDEEQKPDGTRPTKPSLPNDRRRHGRRGRKDRKGHTGHKRKPCGQRRRCSGRHGRGRGNGIRQIHILKKIIMLRMNFGERVEFICTRIQSRNDSGMKAWTRNPEFQQKIADKKECCGKENQTRIDCFTELKEKFQDNLCNRTQNDSSTQRFKGPWKIMKEECCKFEDSIRYKCFDDVREKKIQGLLSHLISLKKGESKRWNKRVNKKGKQRRVKGRYAMCCEKGIQQKTRSVSCEEAAENYVRSVRIRGNICTKKFIKCCTKKRSEKRRGGDLGRMRGRTSSHRSRGDRRRGRFGPHIGK